MTKLTDIFETRECTRCGGSGRHSYNMRDGDRCWGCSGSGQMWSKADAPLVEELRAAIKKVGETQVRYLVEGETVLLGERYYEGIKRMRRWVEVVEVTRLDEECGWKNYGTDDQEATDWYHRLVLSDGQVTERTNGSIIVKRKHRGIRDERIRELLSPACLAKIDAAIAKEAE